VTSTATEPRPVGRLEERGVQQTALPRRARVARALAPDVIGGLYVLVAMIILFSVWVPETFPNWDTARQILNNNSVRALAALALVIPLSAGVFDISVANTMTLSGVMCTYTIVHTDIPIWGAVLIGMLTAVGVGVVNAVVVVVAKIDSLIGTLATGFLIQAVITWRTGSRNVTSDELSATFPKIARQQLFGLTLPVYYVLAIAIALWFLLHHMATGRRMYAAGFNAEAARLAGVPTAKLKFAALITSATLAGFGGIVLAATLGSGSPTGGQTYLLPAFAAVFLGATQLKPGRFNPFGTLVGILMLGTGTTGLALARQPQWIQDTFTGVVLILALGLTAFQVRRAGAESKQAAANLQQEAAADAASQPVPGGMARATRG
jgi:ribose transport system permease protein